jgi:hypothetical protein
MDERYGHAQLLANRGADTAIGSSHKEARGDGLVETVI